MSEHARPHLHTHQRSKMHSAVAGAAYRLGLKLFDERTEKWHDYSRRKGKEVVHGETLGPPGTPPEMLDPATLWNLIEKAEERADAQIARDFRIPIPLGLSETDAIAMARAMAGYIVSRFHVPVSLAVHNDNAVDLDGNQKSADKVGFHAHLYFPTRELTKDGKGEGEAWRFGRKLLELSNKNQSGAIVDSMNEKWSVLANRFARSAGLAIQYEWKSYKRLGLDKTPKPTRARRFGEAAQWYKDPALRPAPDIINHEPGARRRKKEAAAKAVPGSVAPAIDLNKEAMTGRLHARRHAQGIKSAALKVARQKRIAARPIHGKAPLLNRVTMVGGRTLRVDSHLRLSEAMRRAGPAPKTDAEHAALERAMFLADLLESLLFAMERGRQQAGDFAMEMMRRRMAYEDARVRQEVVDRELRRAEENLNIWLLSHPLRPRLKKVSNEYALLKAERDRAATHVERVHASMVLMEGEMKDAASEEAQRAFNGSRVIRRIVATMEGYKPEFRTVVDALNVHLSDQHKADVNELAKKLGLDGPEMVTLPRSEAAFTNGTRL
ncbi:hypothetical protein ABIE56_000406 [Luteibacter sp. 621]|uniref:MobA/MobL family protein n=1 Tax=Luteibacter sp. 621 TaxID=3373916 RepID=UPI003D2227B8